MSHSPNGAPPPVHLFDEPTIAPPPAPSWLPPGKGRTHPASETFATLVRDIMTHKVVTVDPNDTLRFAATLLSQKGVSGMPVLGSGSQVVGVLSEKDIVRALRDRAGVRSPGGLLDLILETSEGRQKDLLARCRRVLDETKVQTVMSTPAIVVRPDLHAMEAVRMMLLSRINRLPVVENGKLVGIVTRGDVLRQVEGSG
ncbi:MAG TPA: CBS domain-containing protein [Thermoplasmata archaeon]|nr:CBS domain-containing protein [Thermoplasmata archaeon]